MIAVTTLFLFIGGTAFYVYDSVRGRSFEAARVDATDIRLTAPAPGTAWNRGSEVVIQWNAVSTNPGATPTVSINLKQESGEVEYLLAEGPYPSSFAWMVGEFPGMASLFDIPDGAYIIEVCSSRQAVCDRSPSPVTVVTPEVIAIPWGAPGDEPLPADYNGDGKADLATWSTQQELLSILYLGYRENRPTATATAEDYNGDGSTEVATWNNTTRTITIPGFSPIPLNTHAPAGTYVLTPADYDGDGATNPAIWGMPAAGGNPLWYIYTKSLER